MENYDSDESRSEPAIPRPTRNSVDQLDPTDPASFPNLEGYTIHRWIGGGAFGQVYEAHATKFGAVVALKIFGANPSEAILARYEREVRAAARSRSQYVVQVLDIQLEHNPPYIVSELLAGGNMRSWLQQRSQDSDTIRCGIEMITRVCRGLYEIHQAGVIHRDIKPENVILDRSGNPKIADFGLAKFQDTSELLTHSGARLGTIAYMSPEQQVDSKNISPVSDIYSVGIMLYEVVTGKRPWQSNAADEQERILASLNTLPPSPNGIDRRLRRVCMRCVDPDPAQRYQSARALELALQAWLDGEPEPEFSQPVGLWVHRRLIRPVRQRPFRSFGVLLACAAFLVGAVWCYDQAAWHWPSEKYYHSVVERWGVLHGDMALSRAASGRRALSYRVTRQGWSGPIVKVERINGHGTHHGIMQIVDGIGQLDLARVEDDIYVQERVFNYQYRENGQLASIQALDETQEELWALDFSTPTQAKVRFAFSKSNRLSIMAGLLQEGGVFTQPARTEADTMIFDWSEIGMKQRVRFFNANLEPRQSVNGVFGYRQTHDERGRVRSRHNLDADGESPDTNRDGWACKVLEYDEATGQVTSVGFLNVLSQPTLDRNRVAEVRYSFDNEGRPIEAVHLDHQGQSAVHKEGYHQLRWIRNDFGDIIEEHYLDRNGQLDQDLVGFAINKIEYHPATGQVLSYSSLGESREPVYQRNGYHRKGLAYEEGRVVRESYYGIDGKLTETSLGYAYATLEHDDAGRPVLLELFDSAMQRTVGDGGWSALRIEYDADGDAVVEAKLGRGDELIVEERFEHDAFGRFTKLRNFGDSKQPIVDMEGFHGLDQAYDLLGRVKSRTYIGLDDQPTSGVDGISTRKYVYDEINNRVEESYWSESGEPATRAGVHVIRWVFDRFDNTRVQTYYDEGRQPTLHRDLGFSAARSELDDVERATVVKYLDTKGLPVPSNKGSYGVCFASDRFGNIVEEKAIDDRGEATVSASGYAIERMQYDRRGFRVAIAGFDERGEKSNSNLGFHAAREKRNTRNQTELVCFFDESGGRIRLDAGYHARRSVYDANGHLVDESFYDEQEELLNIDTGYARIERRYDLQGNTVSERYFDKAGKAAVNDLGVHQTVFQYNDHNLLSSRRFLNEADGLQTTKWNVALERRTFWPSGRLHTWKYFDQNEQPTSHLDGNHGRRWPQDAGDSSVEFIDQQGRVLTSAPRVTEFAAKQTNAEESGIQPRDLLISYAEQEIGDVGELVAAIKNLKETAETGTSVPLVVVRDRVRLQINVGLGPLGVVLRQGYYLKLQEESE